MSDFPAFQKIPRLNREVVVTEKIDGTNALVSVQEAAYADSAEGEHVVGRYAVDWYTEAIVRAGSRNRWLTPEADNFGFAAWVRDHAEELAQLGPGLHYGEWYGKGIQRGYGLDERRFALFNSARWTDNPARPECCDVVPVLHKGIMSPDFVEHALAVLETCGSKAVPGFMRPEGVVVYHTAARQLFKVLLENDDAPKGLAA